VTITRIWAKHGLKPHRLEGCLSSNDPDFETKAADIKQLKTVKWKYIDPSRSITPE